MAGVIILEYLNHWLFFSYLGTHSFHPFLVFITITNDICNKVLASLYPNFARPKHISDTWYKNNTCLGHFDFEFWMSVKHSNIRLLHPYVNSPWGQRKINSRSLLHIYPVFGVCSPGHWFLDIKTHFDTIIYQVSSIIAKRHAESSRAIYTATSKLIMWQAAKIFFIMINQLRLIKPQYWKNTFNIPLNPTNKYFNIIITWKNWVQISPSIKLY